MAEIAFYHLTRSTVTQALPRLLIRTLAAGQRALVLGPSVADLNDLSVALWAQPDWLPHGTHADGDPDLQPIWLSTDPEPVNSAGYLFLTQGATMDRLGDFDRIFDLFDGNVTTSVEAARIRWKSFKEQGHTLSYWQQTETGWQKKGLISGALSLL